MVVWPVEDQWGVKFREFGFSTFSPTPETLEITQLRKLAEEKLRMYQRFRDGLGLSEPAAVALISGAVIAVRGEETPRREPLEPGAGELPPEDQVTPAMIDAQPASDNSDGAEPKAPPS